MASWSQTSTYADVPSLETRLRKRIDDLSDQRDKAIQERDEARLQRDRKSSLLSEARGSRDMWRARAKEWQRLWQSVDAQMRRKAA